MRDYLATVLSVDENIGRLLNYLEEIGELDNTIIVYTSDQVSSSANTAGSTSASCTRNASACRLSSVIPKPLKPAVQVMQSV